MDLDQGIDPKDMISLEDCAKRCKRYLQELVWDEEMRDIKIRVREGHWAHRQFAQFNSWCSKVGIAGEGIKSFAFRLKDVPEIYHNFKLLMGPFEMILRGAHSQFFNASWSLLLILVTVNRSFPPYCVLRQSSG